MSENPDPDLDPRVEYIREFAKLSLWYVHKRLREGSSTFDDAVNTRVNLFRMTRFNTGDRHPARGDSIPEWEVVLTRLGSLFDRYSAQSDTSALETESLHILWPHLRLPHGLNERPRVPSPVRPYECWTCDYSAGDRISLHILNVYQPRSPLSEMRVPFAASLRRLLHDSLVRRPDIQVASCGSWLNSVPTFSDLFPEPWRSSAQLASEVRYTMGHWGQFLDRRGGFHTRNGARFRQTGDFPYACTRCRCGIRDILDHLATRFPEAAG